MIDYDVSTTRVIDSRDVVFNESSRGIESEQEENRIVQFESFPEMEGDSSPPEESPELPQDDSLEEVTTDAQVPRRSSRETKRPDYYGVRLYTVLELKKEPETVADTLKSSDKAHWKVAMQKEMDSIHSNDVWDLVKLPKDRKLVGNKWVFKQKIRADGTVERYKARLVAQGFSHGLDYDETFSPVIRFESVRSLVAISIQKGLKLHQLDVTEAFLNGDLEEEIYMKQPEGFVVKGKEDFVCRLKHSLYGLKQLCS